MGLGFGHPVQKWGEMGWSVKQEGRQSETHPLAVLLLGECIGDPLDVNLPDVDGTAHEKKRIRRGKMG